MGVNWISAFAGMTNEVGEQLISHFSIFSEHIEQALHIFGQGGFEFHYSFSRWVLEFKRRGVEGTAVYNRILWHGHLGRVFTG